MNGYIQESPSEIIKIRNFIEEGLPMLRQITPDAPQEPQTLSGVPPMSFTMNHNSAVCLPLLSESQKLVWVHSHQIDLQLKGHAELEKAFDKFPYLTHGQTTALARRCSLHPDQVKVWFIAQRLRYGISWEYRDICLIQRKFMPSEGNDQGSELQNSPEREIKKHGRKKRLRSKVEEKQRIAKDGGMMGQNGSDEEEKTKQPMKEKDMKLEESNTGQRKKKMKKDNESVMESKRLCSQPEMEKPAHHDLTVPETPLDSSSLLISQFQAQTFDTQSLTDPDLMNKIEALCSITKMHLLGGEPQAEETNSTCFTTDTAKPKELTEGNSSPDAHQQDSPGVNTYSTHMRCSTKSHTQLLMMKMAFSHCQYPHSEQYNRLALLIGVSRQSLVQWFADMRYIIKKRRPLWMTEEQYKQALVNIKCRQYLNTLTTR